MKSRSRLFVAIALATLSACSVKSAYVHPRAVQDRYLITMGDTDRPYESLGYVQLTRKGADLFGFIPLVDADLKELFGKQLISELERSGADGIINLQFHERQWTTAQRVLFALPPLFLFPLPTRVELTGELIRFTDRGPPSTASRQPASADAR